MSWKLDGLTVVLTYNNGTFEKAVTRGNGIVGEVITNNAKTFKNIPINISYKGQLVLRGEAVIKYSDFKKINATIEDADAKYKNPSRLPHKNFLFFIILPARKPPVKQESTQGVQDETQRSDNSSQEASQQTTQAASGRSLAVSGTPQSEDYTSSAAYSKSVFIGDFVVSGISQFGFVADSQVISSNSMTSDKLTGYLDDIVSQSPDSVYIMVGINDLNYGSRSVDDIYKYEKEFIEAVKSALPSANVYVLSVLPISQRFESSSKVKQANIDSLNGMFSENASTLGITYIDVATVFKDGSGYFGSSYTDSGYNLKSGYYAFMLNGIAGVK